MPLVNVRELNTKLPEWTIPLVKKPELVLIHNDNTLSCLCENIWLVVRLILKDDNFWFHYCDSKNWGICIFPWNKWNICSVK